MDSDVEGARLVNHAVVQGKFFASRFEAEPSPTVTRLEAQELPFVRALGHDVDRFDDQNVRRLEDVGREGVLRPTDPQQRRDERQQDQEGAEFVAEHMEVPIEPTTEAVTCRRALSLRWFYRAAYRERNIIERLIGWLKESRRIFTRLRSPPKTTSACSRSRSSTATYA